MDLAEKIPIMIPTVIMPIKKDRRREVDMPDPIVAVEGGFVEDVDVADRDGAAILYQRYGKIQYSSNHGLDEYRLV